MEENQHPFLKMNTLYELTFRDGYQCILFIISYKKTNDSYFYELNYLDFQGVNKMILQKEDFLNKDPVSIANPKCWKEIIS